MDARPFETAAIAAYPTIERWRAVADGLLQDFLRRWDLTPGTRHDGGQAGTVLDVRQADGTPAVLKIGFPHEEAVWEAVALQAMPHASAPEVLRQDAATWAMLLERIEPGTSLASVDRDPSVALRCGGAVARAVASGFSTELPALSGIAATGALRMRDTIAEHRERLDQYGLSIPQLSDAADELARMAGTDAPTALVHGDLNPGNILQSLDEDGTERWVAVDPKGMIGDPAYDLWPLVTQLGDPLGSPDPSGVLADNLAIAAGSAACDPKRAARWALARAGQSTLWYVADDDQASASAEFAVLEAWAGVLG